MTTVLCISDTHVSHASPRWKECERILTWFAEEACVDADLVIHCGDLFDRTASTKDREFVHWWVSQVTSHCPLIIVRGNHDPVGEIAMLAAHASTHRCYTAELPQVIVEAGVVVQCLPWPRTAELAAKGLAGQALDEVAREALRDVLRGLANEATVTAANEAAVWNADAPIILATHALITGAVTSHGQPLVGGELAVGLADLALARADVVVAGHIHKPQSWTYGDVETLYCGSPFRTSFGEHEAKSVVRLAVDGSHPVVSRIGTPAQRMIDVQAEVLSAYDAWELESLGRADDAEPLPMPDGHIFAHSGHRIEVEGAQVRLRYLTHAEHRDFARAEAEKLRDAWLAAGAERVVVEPEVIATSTARAPEIARATSVRAQLEALWTARGDRPADADAVLLGLAEIEGEG